MTYKTNIDPTGRDFDFTPAGDNTRAGFSLETSVADPQTAIDRVNALTIPPSGPAPASINASVTGTYDTGVVIPAFTTANCGSASILSTDALLVKSRGNHSITWGSIFAFSPFATCVKIDGVTRVRVVATSVIVPEDGIGFNITGDVNEIFIDLIEGVLSGKRATMFSHTADSPTPVLYTIGEVFFSDINQVFMTHNPTNGVETIMNFSAAQTVDGGTVKAGSMMFQAITGTLVVNASVLVAECIANISDGATVGIDAQGLVGDTFIEAGGTCIYKSLGILTGDIELRGAGAVAEIQTEEMTGDYTVASDAEGTLKSDKLTGDITVDTGGRLFIIVDTHIGAVSPSDPSDGRINGIINGIRYGNWQNRRETEVLIDSFSTNNQNPTALDTPLQIEFGAAQGTGSDPVNLLADGTVEINEDGQIIITIDVQYGRSGAGGVAVLFFYIEANGNLVGQSALAKLDNSNSDLPMEVIRTIDVLESDEIKVFLVRDSQGMNVGGLLSESPTISINDSPSARIRIERSILE